MAQLSDFDYDLPEDLIAQAPLPDRDGARMLVIDRAAGTWSDQCFRQFPNYLRAGDCLVLNDSRVISSRLLGKTERGARVEVFLLRPTEELVWTALVRPGRRFLPGRLMQFERGLTAEILAVRERGERTLRFRGVANNGGLLRLLDEIGHTPLPPYIHRTDEPFDRDRYQTVFADQPGSVAAPTAGLHFTPETLEDIRKKGVDIARVTLHVGLGTFQPVGREDFEHHRLHREHYAISSTAWNSICSASRVIAVGTTSVRTVESAARANQLGGETNLFLYPGSSFERVGALLTNFHLPRSSLLLLVCAFAGTELVLSAYRHAVRERYRFFSYGDCMLIV